MNPMIRQYLEWGYHLVPYYNRNAKTIKPLIKEWNGPTAPSMESVEGFAARWPDCDWAIVPRGTIVFDIEMKNGKNGISDFEQLCLENGTTFEKLSDNCPMSKTPSNGRHLWMRTSSTLTGGFYLRDGIEIKAVTGSAHVPPSMQREWIRPLCPIDEIPEVPTWLIEELFAAKNERKKQAAFESQKIANGHRREFLLSAAGKFRQDFAASEPELYAVLKTLRDTRCEEPETLHDHEIASIAKDYASKHCDNTHALAIAGDPIAQHAIRMFAPSIKVIEQPTVCEIPKTKTLSEDFCRPNEMLSLWMDWYKHKCVIYQPEMALLSIMTTVSAMVGRVFTWRDFQANLYGLCLGGTGVGKEAVKRIGVEMMEQSGLGFMIGSGSFASDAGVLKELAVNPEIMWVNDEFQTFVSQLAMTQAPTYVKSIERVLTEGYTGNISGRSLKTEHHADIKDPYPVLLALSQPETFWKSMTHRMVESGFLGRFIIVSARPLAETEDGDAMGKAIPPTKLVDLVKVGLSGRSALTAASTASTGVDHRVMESTQEAEDTLNRLRKNDKNRRIGLDESSFAGKMAARTLEKAIRVAMCRAWTDNPANPIMTKEAIEWALAFVQYCDQRMVESMEVNTAGNPYEQALKKLRAMIASSSTTGIQKNTLIAKTTDINTTTRDDILASLISSHTIEEHKVIGPKGGRPVLRYYLKEFAPK